MPAGSNVAKCGNVMNECAFDEYCYGLLRVLWSSCFSIVNYTFVGTDLVLISTKVGVMLAILT